MPYHRIVTEFLRVDKQAIEFMFLTPGYFITPSLIFTVVSIIKWRKPINERLYVYGQ